jgi:hypothetical protein
MNTTTKSPLWPADNPAVVAHLNMLQAVIARMGTNSGQCKTWCLAVVSALFGMAGATKNTGIAAVALIPIVAFFLVDVAYLATEKAFRDHYDKVVGQIHGGSYGLADCFKLSIAPDLAHYGRAAVSWSVLVVYAGLLAVYFLVPASMLVAAR